MSTLRRPGKLPHTAVGRASPATEPTPALRPREAELVADPVARLTSARLRVFDALTELGSSATISELAQRCQCHPNTLREHLSALVEAGLVETKSAPSSGRGRPPVQYTSVSAEGSRPQLRAYASLCDALVGHLQRTSADPTGEAFGAGRAWGESLAASAAVPDTGAAGPLERTVKLLTHLGFAPRRPIAGPAGAAVPEVAPESAAEARGSTGNDASTTAVSAQTTPAPGQNIIELAVCPFLAVAERTPSVVCAVHAGLIKGYVQASATAHESAVDITLHPFTPTQPCQVHIGL